MPIQAPTISAEGLRSENLQFPEIQLLPYALKRQIGQFLRLTGLPCLIITQYFINLVTRQAFMEPAIAHGQDAARRRFTDNNDDTGAFLQVLKRPLTRTLANRPALSWKQFPVNNL